MKRFFLTQKGHIILLFCSLLLSSCATPSQEISPPAREHAQKEQNLNENLRFESLAPLVMLNLDIQRIKKSPLYVPVSVPPPYQTLSQWVNRADEAKFLRSHPLREVFVAFLALNLHGYSPRNAPEVFTKDISRGDFAKTLVELMLRYGANPGILSEFQGQRSPFRDIDETSPYFTAVMIATSRGLLQFKGNEQAGFNPQAPLKRAEAQEAIERLIALFAPPF